MKNDAASFLTTRAALGDVVSRDEELLLEAFTHLYQVYKEQKSGRRYFRPVSLYPVLAKIQKRLDKPVEREALSVARLRREANSPWT